MDSLDLERELSVYLDAVETAPKGAAQSLGRRLGFLGKKEALQGLVWGGLLIGAIALFADSLGPRGAIAQLEEVPAAPTEGPIQTESSPGLLRINLNLANPEDLKVQEGQQVRAGQILADRSRERARLESQRDRLLAAIAQIEGAALLPPSPPQPVPPLPPLPAANFSEQEAAIAQAELQAAQARRVYSTALSADPFLRASASVSLAQAQKREVERDLDLQERKIAAINEIPGLPPEIREHEAARLGALFVRLEEVGSQLAYREAELAEARQIRESQLEGLLLEVERTQAALKLAQSRLDRARGDRQREEYEHQIKAAAAVDRENRARHDYERQQAQFAESVRGREFQLAQLQQRLTDTQDQLENLAVVRAPYDGQISRIRTVRQTDGSLGFELSLRRRGGTAGTAGNNPFLPAP